VKKNLESQKVANSGPSENVMKIMEFYL